MMIMGGFCVDDVWWRHNNVSSESLRRESHRETSQMLREWRLISAINARQFKRPVNCAHTRGVAHCGRRGVKIGQVKNAHFKLHKTASARAREMTHILAQAHIPCAITSYVFVRAKSTAHAFWRVRGVSVNRR